MKFDLYITKINLYETKIKELEEHQPLFFQRKKLKKYYEELDFYFDKLNGVYKEIENEIGINDVNL